MSKIIFTAAVAATLFAGSALAQQQPAPTTPRTQQDASPSTPPLPGARETRLPPASRTFVSEGIQGNLAEVRMGQLAQEKGQSEDIRSFGQMLVNDHGQANERLVQIAEQAGITPPTSPSRKHQAEVDRLSRLPANQFDRAFAQSMVTDHQEDIRKFEAHARRVSANDPTVAFAQETLPTLRTHLDRARSLAEAMGAQAREPRAPRR